MEEKNEKLEKLIEKIKTMEELIEKNETLKKNEKIGWDFYKTEMRPSGLLKDKEILVIEKIYKTGFRDGIKFCEQDSAYFKKHCKLHADCNDCEFNNVCLSREEKNERLVR